MDTHPQRFLLLSAFLFLLGSSVSAQTVGGEYQTLRQWSGQAAHISFGGSVSSAGDVNGDGYDDQIVGAQNASPGGLGAAGSAFVYSGIDGSLLYQLDGAAAGDAFGFAVSGAGDVNGDGFDDVLIGALATDPPGISNSGSAYVYSGADGSLLHQWDGSASLDSFGISVAAAGDVNQDGFDDVIIGAEKASPFGLTDVGSAFVYSGATGAQLYRWNGNADLEYYAWSVSGAGDANGDGFADVLVGAWAADNGPIWGTGTAYLYSGADGSILQQWFGGDFNYLLGYSVSGAGDINGDGFDDVILGATGAHSGGLFTNGAAYAYAGIDGSLLYEWSGAAAGDDFGHSVSGAGDVDGDGVPDLLVSAKNADADGLTDNGTADVYSGADGSLLRQWSGEDDYIRLGDSVSAAGDADGDGFAEVIVGSKDAFDSLQARTGEAYLYHLNPFLKASTDTISANAGALVSLTLDFPDTAALDEFKVLISAAGIGPNNYGVDIPLSRDSLAIATFLGNYPMPTTNMHGTLDAFGDATASFSAPAGINPALIGRTYYLAAIANQPGQLPEYSSVARSLEIIP